MTQAVTDQSFETEVLQDSKPVLVDFWAEWCGPCRAVGPVIDQLAEELAAGVKIVKVNIDENPLTPSKFGVRSIPTLMLFKEGKLVATKVGGGSKQQLTDWLNNQITSAA
ncbi:MAG: thioredoxin [Alphaproteobacteria bacterium]